MITIAKGSALAEQIELARQSIKEWPLWLRRASGIPCPETEDEDRADPVADEPQSNK